MTAFSPADLLTVSAEQQAILRCVTKQPRLSLKEIATKSGLTWSDAKATVADLVRQQRLVEQLHNDQRVFSVRFQFRRSVRNMPAGLLSFYRHAIDNCLAESSVTATLSAELRERLLQRSHKRRLMPDEVLAWQGETMPMVAFIEDGLLMKTRLEGARVSRKQGYLRRTDWAGLVEQFSGSASSNTLKAVTETTLRYWHSADFLDFVAEHGQMANALAAYFSQLLSDCEQSSSRGQTKLWVLEGAHARAGVTTMALNLAILSQRASGAGQTALWTGDTTLAPRTTAAPETIANVATVQPHASGVDLLTLLPEHDYPTQVALDMLLTELARRYETIVCDSGWGADDERMLRLRGMANTLITLTCEASSAEAAAACWQHSQPFALPGQKRVLALNRATAAVTDVDAGFHLVLPDDGQSLANTMDVTQQSGSRLRNGFEDVYRRLSLNHAVALFVPSTMDVDDTVDNTEQVQSALAFLGGVFGGATSSDAEGVWRSEDSGLVTEQVTVVRTFVSKRALDEHLDDVISFASTLKRDMKQEAVAISVDNQLILV